MIETTEVEVKRLGDVDLAFARDEGEASRTLAEWRDEGEAFRTLAEWRDAHVAFFTSPAMRRALGEPSVPIDDDTLVVCTRFRLVERLDEPPS